MYRSCPRPAETIIGHHQKELVTQLRRQRDPYFRRHRRKSWIPTSVSMDPRGSQKMQQELAIEDAFIVRRIQLSDKDKGFIHLLKQLSVCDSVSNEDFISRFHDINSLGDDHVVCVIEDNSGKIIATGSIFIEKKFIRNCGKVGHIEDVVVDINARGKHLGQKIVQFLSDHAKSVGCYKVILDCDLKNKRFYEKCGFMEKNIQMAMYFD